MLFDLVVASLCVEQVGSSADDDVDAGEVQTVCDYGLMNPPLKFDSSQTA
uniref:Uncharacterized protein n=1 Tax=Arion vulgaris TaxID=1028688 RepID=A0A0B7B4X3_9EUPU